MTSPAITEEEAIRWKEWLAQFGIDLMTTCLDSWNDDNTAYVKKLYPMDLRMLPGRESPF